MQLHIPHPSVHASTPIEQLQRSVPNSIPRRKAFLVLFACSLISIVWGFWIQHTNEDGLGDFRAIYYGARTVQHHHDPYKPGEFIAVYRQEGGIIPTNPERNRGFWRAVPICVNLPSTLFVVLPFTLLSWGPAHWLWMVLLASGLVTAGWLVWDMAGQQAPRLTLFLLCVILANCQVLLQVGNASGIAVILCVIAVWTFLKGKYAQVGILCLALGLAIKPQEIGFIWLYFLLAGGVYRRRAVHALAITLVIAVLAITWVSSTAPNWYQEWHSNVAATLTHGDLNDPGPTSFGNAHVGMNVSMQSVISFGWDDPHIYNPASYLIGGSLVLAWIWAAFRSRGSQQNRWPAIASIAALSLLPLYHREYDDKILLLAVPAVAALWNQGSSIRKLGAAVTSLGVIITADIPVATLVILNKSLHLPQDHLSGKLSGVLLTRTPTFGLILVGAFYLWTSIQQGRLEKSNAVDESRLEEIALSA